MCVKFADMYMMTQKKKFHFPNDWKCPLCGAAKSDFKAEETSTEQTKSASVPMKRSDEKLSAGQLAALCSNLARGCEKQYKPEESKLFKELADYFSAVTPKVDDPTVEKLYEALMTDAENYAGAARICVWGEKVTRMLASLVNRYLKEGEKMLEDTNIWVCTTCGFVYVGDNPPELCPVCKVPDWKFEKIEGRA